MIYIYYVHVEVNVNLNTEVIRSVKFFRIIDYECSDVG